MAKKNVVVPAANKGMMEYSDDKPDFIKDSGRGRGQENVTIDDLVIPRVDVIQDLSPQRKKTEPEYIDGAEEGMLFNTVTGELYGTELLFVPVYFRKEFVIWRDRKKGGGFRGAFPTMEEAERAMADLENREDHDIIDTAQHFGLILGEDATEEVCISMSKSKMKASRNLNTMAKLAGGDRFSRVYNMSAFADKNAAGESYFNIKFKQLGYVNATVYAAAEKMYESISSGRKNVAYDGTASVEDDETDM